jgi:CRISPR-associated protein Csx14
MAEYRIPLDPRNPGQFFACCGLFELAELAAPGTETEFQDAGSVFVLRTEASLPPEGLALMPRVSDPDDEALEPLGITFGNQKLELDWWLNETHTSKTSLKTWGGQQTPRHVLGELLRLLDHSVGCDSLFGHKRYTKSRFGVDPRSAWEALDAGYSPNDIGQEAVTFPWVEVLAVLGLQGFRPSATDRTHYRYSAWGSGLPLAVARAACAAPWPGLRASSFQFSISVRGQGYKTFLFAEGVSHV